MNTKDTYIAWLLLGVAVLAWTATGWFSWTISSVEAQRANDIEEAQRSSAQQNTVVRIHALVQDTTAQRAELDQLLTTDVVSAANTLKGIGSAAGVKVTLSGAVPETSSDPTSANSNIQVVGFSLQADGTFAALMRVEQLLETLPLASSVDRVDLQRTPSQAGAQSGTWHMEAFVRVLTTAPISS